MARSCICLDPVGNRATVVDNGVSRSYLVNSLNQYTRVAANAATYDSNVCRGVLPGGMLAISRRLADAWKNVATCQNINNSKCK